MPGTGLPSGPAITTVSPIAKISGWPGTVRSGRPRRRPARSAGAPSHSAAGEARTPAAQIRVLACRFLPPYTTPSAEHSVTACPSITSTPMTFQRALRIGREIVGKTGQHARAPPRSAPRAPCGCRCCGSRAAACRCANSAMVPASSTPVGPAPTMTKVKSAARRSRIALALGALEGDQDSPPQRGGVLERFQARRERLPFVMAEIGVARAGGEHQRVVEQRIAVIEQHALVRRVDAGHRRRTRS